MTSGSFDNPAAFYIFIALHAVQIALAIFGTLAAISLGAETSFIIIPPCLWILLLELSMIMPAGRVSAAVCRTNHYTVFLASLIGRSVTWLIMGVVILVASEPRDQSSIVLGCVIAVSGGIGVPLFNKWVGMSLDQSKMAELENDDPPSYQLVGETPHPQTHMDPVQVATRCTIQLLQFPLVAISLAASAIPIFTGSLHALTILPLILPYCFWICIVISNTITRASGTIQEQSPTASQAISGILRNARFITTCTGRAITWAIVGLVLLINGERMSSWSVSKPGDTRFEFPTFSEESDSHRVVHGMALGIIFFGGVGLLSLGFLGWLFGFHDYIWTDVVWSGEDIRLDPELPSAARDAER